MLGDRDLSLIRRAIFDGRIKAEEVRLLDRKWWRWLGWLLDHVESEATLRLFEVKHALHCGVLSYQNKQETFDLHWDEAVKLESLIRRELLPWIKGETGDRKSAAKKLSDQWDEIFGSADNPDTQSRIDATIKHLQAQAAASRGKFGGVK